MCFEWSNPMRRIANASVRCRKEGRPFTYSGGRSYWSKQLPVLRSPPQRTRASPMLAFARGSIGLQPWGQFGYVFECYSLLGLLAWAAEA